MRLRHMLEASEEAIAIGRERSRTSLLAVMNAIEIVGEAAGRMSPEGRPALRQIPWADIVGMQNRLIHADFDVDAIVWKTVDNVLPRLIRDLRTFLSSRA